MYTKNISFKLDFKRTKSLSFTDKRQKYLLLAVGENVNATLDTEFYEDLEETVNEHEQGLGVLNYIKAVADKVNINVYS